MTKVSLPQPRAHSAFGLLARKGQWTTLALGLNRVLFFKDVPVAVKHDGALYYCNPDAQAPITRMVNEMASECPLVRADASQFDFILSQVLTTTGLRLVAKEREGA